MTSAMLSFVALISLPLASAARQSELEVRLCRAPGGELQPQVVVEGETCHLHSSYGTPKAGDLTATSSSCTEAQPACQHRVVRPLPCHIDMTADRRLSSRSGPLA